MQVNGQEEKNPLEARQIFQETEDGQMNSLFDMHKFNQLLWIREEVEW